MDLLVVTPPQILRSRVAPFAAVYGVVLGSAINWSDDAPSVRPLVPVLMIGALSVVPALFGYLIVREARQPSLMYGVFAPVYVVMVAVIALMVTTMGGSGDTAALAFFIVIGMP